MLRDSPTHTVAQVSKIAGDIVEVILAPGAERLAALVDAAGGRAGAQWADVLLVDARGERRGVAAGGGVCSGLA